MHDLLLPVAADAPSLARQAVVQALPDHPRRADILLMTSEVVSNAVRHSGMSAHESIPFRLQELEDWVRVEVYDAGDAFQRPPRPATSLLPEGGFGLQLVDRLADNWGVDPGGFTSVWFEVK